MAHSLGKVPSLNDLLTKLDDYFGVVQKLETMNRHLYTIKQGTKEGVTELAVRLCHQIRAIQGKYPGEIPVMEESKIKRAQFLGGLWLEVWAAMAHTKETGVEGKKADYHQLLRIAQQLENEAKANDAPKVMDCASQGVSTRVANVWGRKTYRSIQV